MGTGLASAKLVLMSQLRRESVVGPWADCSAGTNELIGEDLPMIISLEC